MTSKTCLVTGGAGFIGCAIASGLADRFDRVVALDVLHPQVHPTKERPAKLPESVSLVVGDITCNQMWKELLRSVTPDIVVHLAAETGTGQSLTESTRHAQVNVSGTAMMLDAFAQSDRLPAQILLASSRAAYGEGAWRPVNGSHSLYPGPRTPDQLADGIWDFPDLLPLPSTASVTVPHPISVYGATKLAQEHLLHAWATAYRVGLKILRLQNVYGPGQSYTNPYTGIVALFCRLANQGATIPLFEDGNMLRDFVYIDDVVDAVLRTVDSDAALGSILDIGTGEVCTVANIASIIASHYGAPEPQVTGQYRLGDVRHASCTIERTAEHLGWRPRVDTQVGIPKLAAWMEMNMAEASKREA